MSGAYPVGVGQVDTYGCCWIGVAGENGGCNHLGGYTFHLVFLERLVDGRVVLEPLSFCAECLGAFAGGDILEVHDGFPRSGHAQGVAVCFDESVDEVYLRESVFGPFDRIFIECGEVASAVEVDERAYDLALCIVFGIVRGTVEVFHDFFDGRGVESADLVGIFHNFAIGTTLYAGVETVGYRSEVVGLADGVVVCLDFGLGYAGCIHIVCRCGDQVDSCILIHALGVESGIEYNFDEFIGIGRSGTFGQSCNLSVEEVAAESRCEFVGRVVVVYAVSEPYLLDVCFECLVVGVGLVAVIVGVYGFEELAHCQVVAVVLIP